MNRKRAQICAYTTLLPKNCFFDGSGPWDEQLQFIQTAQKSPYGREYLI